MAQSMFGVCDYVMIVATIVASTAIGLYYRFSGGKQKTNEEYLLADRNMSIMPVAVSLMASFMSAISLLGGSSETYTYGMIFIVINLPYGYGTPIVTKLYLPVFFGLQKTSTYEYLELRFGRTIRLLTSLTYTLQMLLYNGVVLYAPAIALEAVTGLDRHVSILVVGLSCTLYATVGGMKAVVITDVLQTALMFAAVISVIVFCSIQLGGFEKIFHYAQEGERLDFSNISVSPTERHTWWSLNIGGLVNYLSLYAVNQTQVQRLLTVSSLKRSQACLWWSWPVLLFMSLCSCVAGIAIYAVYRECDPLTSGSISALDQLMPFYVVDSMRRTPGMLGLFVAGIFSATLSTVSSACNSLAAVTLNDYLANISVSPTERHTWWSLNIGGLVNYLSLCCHVRESYVPWLTKLLACIFGLVFLGVAFFAQLLGGVLQASLTIFAVVGGPVLGVFTLGMFTTFANEAGACAGLLSGLAMTLWINFGQPRPAPVRLPVSVHGCTGNFTLPLPTAANPSDYFYMYRLSYLWTSPIGLICALVVGSAVSLLWRHQQPWQRAGRELPDPALFTPPLANRLRRTLADKSHAVQQVDESALATSQRPRNFLDRKSLSAY